MTHRGFPARDWRPPDPHRGRHRQSYGESPGRQAPENRNARPAGRCIFLRTMAFAYPNDHVTGGRSDHSCSRAWPTSCWTPTATRSASWANAEASFKNALIAYLSGLQRLGREVLAQEFDTTLEAAPRRRSTAPHTPIDGLRRAGRR